MHIVSLCGFQGSGKDTVAGILIEKGYMKLSFASILKDILSILFSWDRDMLEGLTKEAREKREIVDTWWSEQLSIPNFTPRYALQYIGTEVMRNHFHQDIWVLAIRRKLMTLPPHIKGVVFSDVRYENEIDMLQSFGSDIYYIIRKQPSWLEEAKEGNLSVIPKYLHQSEWDWIKRIKHMKCINNNGTLEELATLASSI